MDNLKNITIDDESYVISKISAMDSFPLVHLMSTKLVPLATKLFTGNDKESDSSIDDVEQMIQILVPIAEKITEEEYQNNIKLCLTHAFKVMKAGNTPIMRKDGTYGVEGFEFDVIKTFKIVVEVIKHNVGVFFREGFLNSEAKH